MIKIYLDSVQEQEGDFFARLLAGGDSDKEIENFIDNIQKKFQEQRDGKHIHLDVWDYDKDRFYSTYTDKLYTIYIVEQKYFNRGNSLKEFTQAIFDAIPELEISPLTNNEIKIGNTSFELLKNRKLQNVEEPPFMTLDENYSVYEQGKVRLDSLWLTCKEPEKIDKTFLSIVVKSLYITICDTSTTYIDNIINQLSEFKIWDIDNKKDLVSLGLFPKNIITVRDLIKKLDEIFGEKLLINFPCSVDCYFKKASFTKNIFMKDIINWYKSSNNYLEERLILKESKTKEQLVKDLEDFMSDINYDDNENEYNYFDSGLNRDEYISRIIDGEDFDSTNSESIIKYLHDSIGEGEVDSDGYNWVDTWHETLDDIANEIKHYQEEHPEIIDKLKTREYENKYEYLAWHLANIIEETNYGDPFNDEVDSDSVNISNLQDTIKENLQEHNFAKIKEIIDEIEYWINDCIDSMELDLEYGEDASLEENIQLFRREKEELKRIKEKFEVCYDFFDEKTSDSMELNESLLSNINREPCFEVNPIKRVLVSRVHTKDSKWRHSLSKEQLKDITLYFRCKATMNQLEYHTLLKYIPKYFEPSLDRFTEFGVKILLTPKLEMSVCDALYVIKEQFGFHNQGGVWLENTSHQIKNVSISMLITLANSRQESNNMELDEYFQRLKNEEPWLDNVDYIYETDEVSKLKEILSKGGCWRITYDTQNKCYGIGNGVFAMHQHILDKMKDNGTFDKELKKLDLNNLEKELRSYQDKNCLRFVYDTNTEHKYSNDGYTGSIKTSLGGNLFYKKKEDLVTAKLETI